MRRITILFALSLLFLALACGKDEKQKEETAPEVTWTMQDRILDSKSLGFRITAPPAYEWSGPDRPDKDTYTFTATRNTTEIRLTVHDRQYGNITEIDVQKLINDKRAAWKAAGITVENVQILQQDGSKMGPGYTYFYRISAGSGDPAVVHGFVTARGRLYRLEKTSNDPWDTFALRPFFRALTPVE